MDVLKVDVRAKIRLNTCSDPSVNSWYNFSAHEWCAYQRNYDLLDKDQEDWGALNSFLSSNMKSPVSFRAHHLVSLCFSCLPSEVTVITFCWDYIVEHTVILFNVSVEEISYTDRLILSLVNSAYMSFLKHLTLEEGTQDISWLSWPIHPKLSVNDWLNFGDCVPVCYIWIK